MFFKSVNVDIEDIGEKSLKKNYKNKQNEEVLLLIVFIYIII